MPWFAQVSGVSQWTLQEQSPVEYFGALAASFLTSVASSLLVAEPVKALLITLISPQLWPSVVAFRHSHVREVIRYGVRAIVGLAYFALRML
jgi:hypothetical protein